MRAVSPALRIAAAICRLAVIALFLQGGTAQAGAARQAYPVYDLSVSFAPPYHRINGTARIRLPHPAPLTIDLGTLRVLSLTVDNRSQTLPHAAKLRIARAASVVIRYQGEFDDLLDSDIRPGSIILTENWYPAFKGMARYRLRARLPKGYHAVSEADHISRTEASDAAEYRFDFPYPLSHADGISFAASDQYQVGEKMHDGILLQTYLKPETAGRSQALLERTATLLDNYQKRFVPYPYKRMAIVEAPLSSSLSMPTQVLLDRPSVLEPPDTTPTLGHEIVHQWFGNTAYIDFDSGNWAEGAALYFADHELELGQENGYRCRKAVLTAYGNRLRGRTEMPLTRFSMREDMLSQSIGYGRSAFIYHMLREEIGDQAFYDGLRLFFRQHRQRVSSWRDLRASFERTAHTNLGWFFRQWVEKTGVPRLRAAASVRSTHGGRFETVVNISQEGPPRRLAIPIVLRSADGEKRGVARLERASGIFRFDTIWRPHSVTIDDNYDVLRSLTPAERYPTLEQLQTESHLTVVLPRGDPTPYREVVTRIQERHKLFRLVYVPRDFRHGDSARPTPAGRILKREWIKEAAQLSVADLNATSLLVLGRNNPILESLARTPAVGPRSTRTTKGFLLDLRNNPANPAHILAVLDSDSAEDTVKGLERIENLANYSGLLVADGKILEKWMAPSQRGIVIDLATEQIRDASSAERR